MFLDHQENNEESIKWDHQVHVWMQQKGTLSQLFFSIETQDPTFDCDSAGGDSPNTDYQDVPRGLNSELYLYFEINQYKLPPSTSDDCCLTIFTLFFEHQKIPL